MREHNLQGWYFQYDRAKNRFGLCSHAHKRISMSEELVRANTLERCLQTMKHEIAHALVGPGHGHDFVWQRQARALGIPADRCWTEADTVAAEPKYKLWCPTCKTVVAKRHKRSTKKQYHTTCKTIVVWV
jgi:predicted SprT family Zn-dependent metalloprotease